MNVAAPLCTKCRRPLALIRSPKPFARLSKATFISLNNTSPPTSARLTDYNADTNLNTAGSASASTAEERRRMRLRLQGKKRPAKPIDPKPADFLESIFEEALASNPEPKDPQPQTIDPVGPYRHVEDLRKLLSANASPMEAWSLFVEHFSPNAKNNDKGFIDQRSLPSYLHSPAKQLLGQIIAAKSIEPFSQTLPTATEVSTLYAQLGMLSGNDWADMVVNLLGEVLKIRQRVPRDRAGEEMLLSDLLGAWNVVCRRRNNALDFPPAISPFLNWSNLPLISTEDITYIRDKHGAMSSFFLLTPYFRPRHLENIPIIAIATLALLEKECPLDKTMLLESSLFISRLHKIIGTRGYDISQLRRANDGSALDIVSKFAIQECAIIVPTPTAAPVSPQRAKHPKSVSAPRRIGIHSRIQDALRRRDVTQLDRLWDDAIHLSISRSDVEIDFSTQEAKYEHETLSGSLCNYFILAYMTLRKPNNAINVWNHMVRHDLTPTLKTWNAMLDGCRASKDRNALEAVWNKLNQSELTPDIVCWTTRIIGLIDCGRVDVGLRALDEMGHTWLSAAKSQQNKAKLGKSQPSGDVQGAVRPTIETINAVIAGLLRKRKPEAIRLVVSWSKNFGIQPDIVTYNTLLRRIIRDGKSNEIPILLKQMQRAGVEADVVTYTTLIEEIFQPTESTTPEEQRQLLHAILSDMEAAGVEANLHTYAKIIYQILRTPNEDFTAINAVLERMALHDLQPSSHIYTMLVTHYFNRENPDLEAARNLIQRAQLEPGSTDHIFWDRVVEGYANAGDTASAMRVLGKLDSAQNVVGWVALRALLLALAQNQEWDAAKTLVKNTRVDRGGPVPDGEHGREGQHPFWKLATELELV